MFENRLGTVFSGLNLWFNFCTNFLAGNDKNWFYEF